MAKLLAFEAVPGEGDVEFYIKPFEAQEDMLWQGWGIEGQEKSSCLYLLASLGDDYPASLFYLWWFVVAPGHVDVPG